MPRSSLFPCPERAADPGRRWLFGLASLLAILVAAMLVLSAVGWTVQSGVRAYVGGESNWSRAQKDAVLDLDRYIETGSEEDWTGYLRELQVTLGDRRARIELERRDADMKVVEDGFIAGRNSPEDVPAMALVFRTFRQVGYIDRAIAVWAEADREIDRLEAIAARVRTAVQAGDTASSPGLIAELDAANDRLTVLERDFSQTLGEGARWLRGVLFGLSAAMLGLLVIIVIALGRFMVGRLRATDLAAAATLRASEARLRLLLNHLPAVVWTTDDHLKITSLTGDGLTRLGIDESALVGRPVEILFEDGDETQVIAAAHRTALGGIDGDSYRATVAGRIFQVHVEPLTVEGRVIGVISVGLDLTDRLELETRLERSTRLESIGRLAGGVAHDFNNLLTAITGYSDLLLSALPEGHQRQDAEEIRRAATRATELTSQLLAFGRRSVLKPEIVSPNAVIDEMRNMVHRLIGDDVAVEFDLDPTVPFVLADPGQLEQVILNLAVNARDAMPDGGRLTIATRTVRAHPEGPGVATSHVTISVRDTGVGMDQATQARVFEPFFTTKGHGRGTGLGLSTAYGIVGQSGGSIGVVSELGVGSTFTISLAAASPSPGGGPEAFLPAPAEAFAALPGGGPGDPSVRPTILLAEDEPAVRALVARILRKAGFTVVAAVDGREALELAATLPTIDLLLTDVMMPRLNGPDLAAALRKRSPDQRVLFMSGFTDDVLGERGILFPEVDLLTKPFAADALLARVREVLEIPRAAGAALPVVA
ncbi:MAG TPA: response regulator [Candidatus Limnocylindrales bacterium]|nr:response regulator [Candidatus Limnocylindrales bacterium]